MLINESDQLLSDRKEGIYRPVVGLSNKHLLIQKSQLMLLLIQRHTILLQAYCVGTLP